MVIHIRILFDGIQTHHFCLKSSITTHSSAIHIDEILCNYFNIPNIYNIYCIFNIQNSQYLKKYITYSLRIVVLELQYFSDIKYVCIKILQKQ